MPPFVAVGMEIEEVDGDKQYQRGVKHLYDNGVAKLPNKYVLPVAERSRPYQVQPNDKKMQSLELPMINFAELLGPKRSQVLKQLAYACETYGFFQLVNHDISEEIIARMKEVSKRFFELPFEERSKYMSSDMGVSVRYGTSMNQNKDSVFFWRDFLKFMAHPLQEFLPFWPSFPSDFRSFATTYAKETKRLFQIIVGAILESLGVWRPEDCNSGGQEIMKQLDDGSQLMVINCYPPCPEPDLTLGMPPHSDYGFLTLLLQDDVEGLQIEFQDDWLTIHPIPASFVINVGDHLEIFSNGRYKSVLHRVLVNTAKARVSVASLHSFPLTWKVSPSPKLVDEANPKRYMDTDYATFLDYIQSHEPKKKKFLESRKITKEQLRS